MNQLSQRMALELARRAEGLCAKCAAPSASYRCQSCDAKKRGGRPRKTPVRPHANYDDVRWDKPVDLIAREKDRAPCTIRRERNKRIPKEQIQRKPYPQRVKIDLTGIDLSMPISDIAKQLGVSEDAVISKLKRHSHENP